MAALYNVNLDFEKRQFENQVIRVSLYYDKEKGYWYVAVPTRVSKMNGFTINEFGSFTGFKKFIHNPSRQSAKQLAIAISIIEKEKDKILEYFNN